MYVKTAETYWYSLHTFHPSLSPVHVWVGTHEPSWKVEAVASRKEWKDYHTQGAWMHLIILQVSFSTVCSHFGLCTLLLYYVSDFCVTLKLNQISFFPTSCSVQLLRMNFTLCIHYVTTWFYIEPSTYMIASMSQDLLMFWMVYPISCSQRSGRLVYLRQQLAINTKTVHYKNLILKWEIFLMLQW